MIHMCAHGRPTPSPCVRGVAGPLLDGLDVGGAVIDADPVVCEFGAEGTPGPGGRGGGCPSACALARAGRCTMVALQ